MRTRELEVRKLIKVKRAAVILDCSIRHVYNLEERGELEFVRDNRSVWVVADSVDRRVDRLRAKAAAAKAGKNKETESQEA